MFSTKEVRLTFLNDNNHITLCPDDIESKKWLMSNLAELNNILSPLYTDCIGVPLTEHFMYELQNKLIVALEQYQYTGNFPYVKFVVNIDFIGSNQYRY